jgi:enoyl-CoA hydratase/carnithine racemase
MTATLDYARTLATDISPSSLRESKRQLYADLHGDVGTAVAESERLLERMATEPDFREGVAAWQEKRPPHFQGF